MLRYLIKRVLILVGTLLGVSVIVFGAMRLVPDDPISYLAGPFATEQQRDQIRAEYGLDRPLYEQYFLWLKRAVKGDFGKSLQFHAPVVELLASKVANTLILVGAALLIAVAFGWTLGVASGLSPGSWLDRIAIFLSLAGISLPSFWFGLVLVVIFAIDLQLFPASGITDPRGNGGVIDVLWHLVLPALATAVLPAGMLVRMTRTAVIEISRLQFINALRVRGMPQSIVRAHIVKNAMPTILNVTGMQAGFLLTAAIFSEVVFNWPGLGLQIYAAVTAQDYPTVQGAVLMVSLLFLIFNFLIDILRPMFDPRLSLS